MLPDLSAPKYQLPRPPPPPLFSTSWQLKSSAHKRSRDAAFGEDGSTVHLPSIWSNDRPRLATTKMRNDEDVPLESVEHDTLEEGQAQERRREADVDLTQDLEMSTWRRGANVGHKMTDNITFADVEPKSESPDPQASLQQLKPTSRFGLEILENAAATTQITYKPASLTRSEEEGEGPIKVHDNRTPRQSSHDYGLPLSSRNTSAGQKATVLDEASTTEVMQHGRAANEPLQKHLRLQTLHKRPNAPITPPSDASPANVRGKLSHPSSKSAASSVRAPSISNKFKPAIPRRDAFELQSSIEDSQMSPRSKEKSAVHTDRDATSGKTGPNYGRAMSQGGKTTIPFSEAAQLYDGDTPIVPGKRARNGPVYNWSENLSILGDEDDYQPQDHRATLHRVFEASAAVQETLDEEESTDHSEADSQERKEDLAAVSSKTGSPKDGHNRLDLPDDESSSLPSEHSESNDNTDTDSNKENHGNAGIRRLPAFQVHKHIADTEMGDAYSEAQVNRSLSNSQGPGERVEGVETSKGRTKSPLDIKNKHQTTIDILNGSGMIADDREISGEITKDKKNLRTAATHSHEAQDNASTAAESHRKHRSGKKLYVEGSSLRLEVGAGLLELGVDRDELAGKSTGADGRHAVPDVAKHKSSRANLTSEAKTPTSTGSAGNQLQESLQASTQEESQNPKATATSRSESRLSIPSTARADIRLVKNKVYEGIVRANEGDSALIELQGIKGNPSGLLHKNGIPLGSSRGPIATKLSLGQTIKVKLAKSTVSKGSVLEGSDAIIRLSMFSIDQTTGELIPPFLHEPQKQQRDPSEHQGHLGQKHGPLSKAGNAQPAVFSKVRQSPSRANQRDNNNVSANDPKESSEQGLNEVEYTGANDKTDGDVESTHAKVRASTPEKGGQQEPRFGLGFTDTPRKRKQRTFSDEDTTSGDIAKTARDLPNKEEMPVASEEVPLVDVGCSRSDEVQEITSSRGDAVRNTSTPPKKRLKKTKSQVKLMDKSANSHSSAKMVESQARQDLTVPQEDSNASENKSDRVTGIKGPPPPSSSKTKTTRKNAKVEENFAFPPTMSKEQYIALRERNLQEIACRDASGAGNTGDVTPSGHTNARPAIQAAKSISKKQRDKLVGERSLPAVLDRQYPPAQSVPGNTSRDKRNSAEHTAPERGSERATSDQMLTRIDRKGINRQLQHDDMVPFLNFKVRASKGHGSSVSAEGSASDSQATATPTRHRSASRTPTEAPYGVRATSPVRSTSKPEPQVADLKPHLVKPISANSAQAKTSLSSKAVSLAELRTRKELAKKSSKASASSLSQFKSIPTTSRPRMALTLGSDSDDSASESESESESDSEDAKEQRAGAAVKRKALQKTVLKLDETIRDRSTSVDLDDDDESA